MADFQDDAQIFHNALAIANRKAREAYLSGACQGNEELRRHIDELLAAYGDAGSFMKQPPLSTRQTEHGQATTIEAPLIARTASELSGDVQPLLRKRLVFFCLLIAGLYSLLLLRDIGETLTEGRDLPRLSKFCVWLGTLGLAGLLWKKKDLGLSWLRAIELFVFGFATYDFALIPSRYVLVHRLPSVHAEQLGLRGALAVAGASLLAWILMIVGYGTLVPNTWRRCALVVGLIALLPLVMNGFAGLTSDAIPRSMLPRYLFAQFFWLALICAISIYGCHRIEVHRQDAMKARELGQYQLKHRIGTGGMGEVYLAAHRLLRRPCAIKLIRPERSGDASHLARFEREVQATATLTHPNTIQIFDYGHANDGTFYYVMEYLPGLSLQQLGDIYSLGCVRR